MTIFPKWIKMEMKYGRKRYERDEPRDRDIHHLENVPMQVTDTRHRKKPTDGFRKAKAKRPKVKADMNAFDVMIFKARLKKASASDIDKIVYRVEGGKTTVLAIIEAAGIYHMTPEDACQHYLRDMLSRGGTRRMQRDLLLELGRAHACPVLFVLYADAALLAPKSKLWVCRLDADTPAWHTTTVERFQKRLRQL